MTHNREKAERLHVCAHVPHVFLTVCLSGMFDSPVELWACLCGTTWELGKSSGVFVHWSHDRRLCPSKALNYGFWQQIPEMTLTQIKSNRIYPVFPRIGVKGWGGRLQPQGSFGQVLWQLSGCYGTDLPLAHTHRKSNVWREKGLRGGLQFNCRVYCCYSLADVKQLLKHLICSNLFVFFPLRFLHFSNCLCVRGAWDNPFQLHNSIHFFNIIATLTQTSCSRGAVWMVLFLFFLLHQAAACVPTSLSVYKVLSTLLCEHVTVSLSPYMSAICICFGEWKQKT